MLSERELLTRPSLNWDDRQKLVRALTHGPWCWPADEKLANLALSFRREGPAPLRPGQALLLTANKNRASLWSLSIRGTPVEDDERIPVGAAADAAWANAAEALSRSLPVLRSALRRTQALRWRPLRLASEPIGPREARELVFDG